MIGFYSVGIGQITVNTNFTPNIAGHIDSRCVLTNLADTSTISFKYEGMLIYVAVLNKFYYYETYWKELASETLIDSYVSNNGYLTGVGTSNYLPVWGGASYLTYSSGTGFVKVTNGNISYDNSTYLTSEVDGSTTNEIEVVDEAYSAANFNGGTTSGVSQDDFYDYQHTADTDDDGKVNIVDLSSAGFVKSDASGNISVDANTYLTSETDGSTSNEIQTIDTFQIYDGNKIRISLQRDGEVYKTLTLPSQVNDSLVWDIDEDSLYLRDGVGFYKYGRIISYDKVPRYYWVENPRKYDIWYSDQGGDVIPGIYYYDGDQWNRMTVEDNDTDPYNEGALSFDDMGIDTVAIRSSTYFQSPKKLIGGYGIKLRKDLVLDNMTFDVDTTLIATVWDLGQISTTETDPIFAADSSKILHWSDTTLVKGITSQFDLASSTFWTKSGSNIYPKDANYNVAIGSYSASRKLDVQGDVVISDLETTNPTKLVGADANGVLSGVTLGTNLSYAGTTLNATDNNTTYSAGFGLGLNSTTFYNSRYWKNQDTVKTTLTGLLKATSGVLSAASAGTDYFVLPSLTSGSVLFSNGTTIAQDNTKFFWDNTNKRLGIGLATPAERLTIKGYQGTDFIGLNNELSTNNRTFRILAGIGGITYNGFSIYDTDAAATRLYISNTGNVGIGNYDDTYKLSVEGTFQVKTRTGTAVLGAAFDGVGKLVQMSGLPPMGAGKPNKIAYWQNDNTLTYSNYYHIDAANRRFGINNSSPTDRLTITGYQTTDFIGLNNELSTNNRTFQLMAGYSGVGYNGFSIYDTYAAATRLHISNTGILRIPTLSTGLTAPSTSGTTKMVISDANGDLSFTAIPAAGITGTGTSNRVAFWTGASTIDDHAGFNYTSADSTMRVANLTVSRMGNNTAYATYISGHDSNGNFGRLDPTNGGLLAIGASGNIIDGRTIAAGSGISVSNGNGASGNPTITNTGVTSLNGKTGALTAVIGKGLKGNVSQSITTNALTTLQITSHANNIQQGTTVDATNEYIKVNSDNAGYYEITYNYCVRQTAQASAFELYSDIYLNGSTTPISDERIIVSLPHNIYQNVSYSTNMYLSDNDYVQVKTSPSQDVGYTIYNYVITIKKIQ